MLLYPAISSTELVGQLLLEGAFVTQMRATGLMTGENEPPYVWEIEPHDGSKPLMLAAADQIDLDRWVSACRQQDHFRPPPFFSSLLVAFSHPDLRYPFLR